MGEAGGVKIPRKPYEEIGAMFNGNEIKIRIPKSTSKPPKLTPSQQKLQNLCTCDDDGSVCSETCGFPGEGDGGPANRLNFQNEELNSVYLPVSLRECPNEAYTPDTPKKTGVLHLQYFTIDNDTFIPDDICEALTNRNALNSELVYSKKEAHDNLCTTCNVTPQNAPKGVEARKVLHPDKDVFLLKIGKQTDEPNRTGNIEVELVTPRAPAKMKPATHSCQQIQCEEEDLPCCLPCRNCRAVYPKKKKGKKVKCFL